MSEGFTCRGCRNFFFQAPKCVSCGAQKLYDSTVKLQGKEIEAQADRIAELEAALNQAKQHFVANEPLKAFVEICAALEGGKS